jgi:hypothetical protein
MVTRLSRTAIRRSIRYLFLSSRHSWMRTHFFGFPGTFPAPTARHLWHYRNWKLKIWKLKLIRPGDGHRRCWGTTTPSTKTPQTMLRTNLSSNWPFWTELWRISIRIGTSRISSEHTFDKVPKTNRACCTQPTRCILFYACMQGMAKVPGTRAAHSFITRHRNWFPDFLMTIHGDSRPPR